MSAADLTDSSAAGEVLPYTTVMEDANGNKKYKCTYPGCGKEFLLKGNLKRHQNIHLGVKKYKCSFCDKAFLRKADMEVHLRVHTGEKPYKCDHEGCTKAFARKSDLLSHQRIHDGKKPFKCVFPGCSRSFARRFDLRKHERTHETTTSKKKRRIQSNQQPINKLATSSLLGKGPVRPSIGMVEYFNNQHAHHHNDHDQNHQCVATQISEKCGLPLAPSLDAFFGSEVSDPSGESATANTASMRVDEGGPSLGAKTEEIYSMIMPDVNASIAIPSSISVQLPMDIPTVGVTGSGPLLFPTIPEAEDPPPGCVPPTVPSTVTGAEATAAATEQGTSTSNLCLHGPACGHLSIQHGNHHDYVVNNQLVCKNGSVKSLRCGKASQTDCRPEDTHRPGCGHLAVRHKDHIDYVVEDNLLCQHHGLVEEPGHLELLDDDFWEFYNAIGFFNN